MMERSIVVAVGVMGGTGKGILMVLHGCKEGLF